MPPAITRCIRAGPRADIYFKPEEVKAAIVTCGGLCPGLNDVIRQSVITMEVGYGVDDIVGIPFGYRGFFEQGLEVRGRAGWPPRSRSPTLCPIADAALCAPRRSRS